MGSEAIFLSKFRALFWIFLVVAVASADPGAGRQVLTAQWQPSGEHLAMLVGSAEGSELWILGREGKMVKRPLSQRSTLVGWTPDGSVVLDEGDGSVRIVSEDGQDRMIRLPSAAVPISCNGQEAFYLSGDNRYLLSVDLTGQTRVVASLPDGIRPSATLAPDGQSLVLRRAVRTRTAWSTEIWLVKDGQASLITRVPASFVGVQWHPRSDSLLLNYPETSGGWDARVVRLGHPKQVQTLKNLASPAQWDRQGRLYTADATGVWSNGKPMHLWGGDVSRLKLWAVSPDGGRVLASWETSQEKVPAYLFEVGQPGAPKVVLTP